MSLNFIWSFLLTNVNVIHNTTYKNNISKIAFTFRPQNSNKKNTKNVSEKNRNKIEIIEIGR